MAGRTEGCGASRYHYSNVCVSLSTFSFFHISLSRYAVPASAYSQVMVGGSNFGELPGAVSVFLDDYAPSPPTQWLRVDARVRG